MNSRVVVIVVIALFALCFVGSSAVAALAFISKFADESKLLSNKDDKSRKDLPSDPQPRDADKDVDDLDTTDEAETAEPDGDAEAFEYEPLESASAQFAIFHAQRAKKPVMPTLEKAAKAVGFHFYRDEIPEDAKEPYFVVRDLSTDDYAVIGGNTLEGGRGLTDDDKKKLPGAKRVTVVDISMGAHGNQILEASKALYEAAQATGGVLWDEEAQEYLSLAVWKERRIDSWQGRIPHASDHFTVFYDTTDHGVDLRTAGLEHFGLPEIVLNRAPGTTRDSAVSFVNVLAQLLVESAKDPQLGPMTVSSARIKHKDYRGYVDEQAVEGGKLEAEVSLELRADKKGSFVEVIVPGKGAASERISALISTFFGSHDTVTKVDHDEKLEALSKKQMQIFKTTVKPRFRKGLKAGEVLLVKAPFTTSHGGREWMWVEVRTIGATGSIVGLLSNDPDDVPELQSGAEVTVKESELFDWILTEADGTRTGNETGKLMQQRLGEE